MREILQDEFRVRVARTRFHLPNGWNYPIIIIALDDPKVLGQFDSEGCTIGINRCLMHEAKTTIIKNILRHELAHYFLYTENRDTYRFIQSHGTEFRDLCRRYGFGEEVFSATIDIKEENDSLAGDIGNEKVIGKIQKLLSLAQSDNQHEAELATLKANQLITQHNLEAIAHSPHSRDEVEYFTKLVLSGPRGTPRMSAISGILKEFFVYPIKAAAGLEITGTAQNIENGEYIAHFLDNELKKIWREHKRVNSKLKEKAFMVALTNSFRRKLKESRGQMPVEDRRALVTIDKELDWATDGIYGGLTTGSSTSFISCSSSALLGAEAGNNLQINKAVSGSGVIHLLTD